MIKLQADKNGMITVNLEELIQFSVAQGVSAFRECVDDHEKELQRKKFETKR